MKKLTTAIFTLALVLFPTISQAQSKADFKYILDFAQVNPSNISQVVTFTLPANVDTKADAYIVLRQFGNYTVDTYLNPTWPTTENPGCYPVNNDTNGDTHFFKTSLNVHEVETYWPITPDSLQPGVNRLMLCYRGQNAAGSSPGFVVEDVILHYHVK